MARAPPDPLHILHNPSGPVTALTVINSQDGTDEQLVSGSENGVITIWDMKTYRPVKTWQAHNSPIIWLGTLKSKGHIISHCRRTSMIVWDSKGQIMLQTPINHEGFCKCNLIGDLLAIPCGKNGINVMDLSLNTPTKLRLDVKNDEGALMAVKFVSENFLIAAYESGYICLWLVQEEPTIDRETRIKCMPTCLALNNGEILVGTSSETLYIFDDRLSGPLKEVNLTNPGLNVIEIRPDARFYVTAGWDKRLRLFSTSKHKKLCVLILHDGALNALSFVGPLLAAGSSDSQISLWDLYNNP